MSAANDASLFVKIDNTLSEYSQKREKFKGVMNDTTNGIMEKIASIRNKMENMGDNEKKECNFKLDKILKQLNTTLKTFEDQDMAITQTHTTILEELRKLENSKLPSDIQGQIQQLRPQQGGRNRRRTRGGFIYKKRNSKSKSKSRSSRRKYRSKSSRTR